MMRALVLIMLLISFQSFGQKASYIWKTDFCEYESTYDKGKYTETHLNNCYNLTYQHNFVINRTPSVFIPEDIKSLNLDSLDKEYNDKVSQLQSLDLPKTGFWEGYRKSIMMELEQFYKLSRIAYQGYLDPLQLKNWHYNDSCLNRHTNALIAGGDSLLNDWNELISMLAKNNAYPDKVWEKYNKQYNSDKRFDYARVCVTTFGWWNCATKHIELIDDKYSWKIKNGEFLKLFIKTETKFCNE